MSLTGIQANSSDQIPVPPQVLNPRIRPCCQRLLRRRSLMMCSDPSILLRKVDAAIVLILPRHSTQHDACCL